MKINYYYQIDYIDEKGLATYIDTFANDELEDAKHHYNILQNALNCIKASAYYALDMYAYIDATDGEHIDDTDVLVAELLPEFTLKMGV